MASCCLLRVSSTICTTACPAQNSTNPVSDPAAHMRIPYANILSRAVLRMNRQENYRVGPVICGARRILYRNLDPQQVYLAPLTIKSNCYNVLRQKRGHPLCASCWLDKTIHTCCDVISVDHKEKNQQDCPAPMERATTLKYVPPMRRFSRPGSTCRHSPTVFPMRSSS